MALGDERAHAELVGERHGRAIATFCRSSVEGIGARSDVGEEAECPGLVATFGAFAGCGIGSWGPASESGLLCHGDGTPGTGRPPAERVKAALYEAGWPCQVGPRFLPSGTDSFKHFLEEAQQAHGVTSPTGYLHFSPTGRDIGNRFAVEGGGGRRAHRRTTGGHDAMPSKTKSFEDRGGPDPSMVPFRYTR